MRHKGSLKLSSNIEPNVSAPLDARTVVDTIEDLLDENSFSYPYVGMNVTVKNNGNIYVLLNDEDTTNIKSWKLIGETTQGSNEGSGESGNYIRIPIAIHATKTKTEYQQGETINLDDLKVQIDFDNGITEEISNYNTNIKDVDTFTAGLKKLVISYYDNGKCIQTTIPLSVSFDASYDKIQYAYKVTSAGAIRNKVQLLSLAEPIKQYSQFQIRMKIHLTIEYNANDKEVEFAVNQPDLFSKKFGTLKIAPRQIGDFDFVIDKNIEYQNANAVSDQPLAYLIHNGSKSLVGMFQVIDYSLALMDEIIVAPIKITATKTNRYFLIGDDLEFTDVVAEVTYNDNTTVTKYSDELTMSQLDMTKTGNQSLYVSYTDNGKTVKSDAITIRVFHQTLTEPQPFTIMTADEWYNAWNYGINIGNTMDAHGSSMLPKDELGEASADRFVETQETHWAMPLISQELIQYIADNGIECVRLPITWYCNSWRDLNGMYHPGKWWLYRVEEVIRWCIDAGLYVFINTHHDSKVIFDLGVNDELLQIKLAQARVMWTEIAERLKNFDHHLAFEGFNELDNLENSWVQSAEAQKQMNQINQVFVDAVRSTGANNTYRILICPFLIHRNSPICADNFVCPKDSSDLGVDTDYHYASKYIGTAVHWYPDTWNQSIDGLMAQIESFGVEVDLPIMVNEYGLSTKVFTDKIKYFGNYVGRAQQHRVKTVAWDNGVEAEHVILYRHNKYKNGFTMDVSQSILSNMKYCYDNHMAIEVPEANCYFYDSSEELLCQEIKSDGTFKAPTWPHIHTKELPYTSGQTVTAIVNQSSAMAVKDEFYISYIAFYNNANVLLDKINGGWGKKVLKGTCIKNGVTKVIVGCYLAHEVASFGSCRTPEDWDSKLFSQGDSITVVMGSADEESYVQLANRVPYKIKTFKLLNEPIFDSNGTPVVAPQFKSTIQYKNGKESVDYYSYSHHNLGSGELVLPESTNEGMYEMIFRYTYNGVTLDYPNTGIMVRTGLYLNKIEKVTLPTTTTFDISEYTKEQIIDKLQEEIEIIGHYSDDTTKAIDYILNTDNVTFSEMGTYHVYISVPTLNYETTFDIQIVNSDFNVDQYRMLAIASKQQLTEWINNSTVSAKVKESWINALDNGFLVSLNDGRVIGRSGILVYDATNDKYYYGNGEQYTKSYYHRDYFTEFVNSELLSSSIGSANSKSPAITIDGKNSSNFVVDTQTRLWVILDAVSSFQDENGAFVGIKNTAYNIRKVNSMDELGAIEI